MRPNAGLRRHSADPWLFSQNRNFKNAQGYRIFAFIA
jgi:hypothetical protein